MEKKIIVISNRFRNNTLHKYEYISAQFSVKTADMFLKRLKNRIDFIAEHPEAGNASVKRKIYAVFCLLRITKSSTVIKTTQL